MEASWIQFDDDASDMVTTTEQVCFNKSSGEKVP